ncbi:hypothetical protein P0F65_17565 [Sphingomonas sp. I4]
MDDQPGRSAGDAGGAHLDARAQCGGVGAMLYRAGAGDHGHGGRRPRGPGLRHSGAGKTSWIATQPPVPGVLYFDAALPGIRHRAKIIAIARDGGAAIEAVWIDTPLATALARNAGRSPDKVVPADAIRSVAAQFEGPSLAEGSTAFGSIPANPWRCGRIAWLNPGRD